MNHARLSGILLIVTGCLHTLTGFIDGYPIWEEMFRDGLIGTATGSVERQMLFWFCVTGIALVLVGLLALSYPKVLPVSFGWALLLLSVVGVLVLGPSGFLLLIPQALYMLVVTYRSRGRSVNTN